MHWSNIKLSAIQCNGETQVFKCYLNAALCPLSAQGVLQVTAVHLFLCLRCNNLRG